MKERRTKKFDVLMRMRLTKQEIEDIRKWAINERKLVMKSKMPKGYEKEEKRHDRVEEREEKRHEKKHDKAMEKLIKKNRKGKKCA